MLFLKMGLNLVSVGLEGYQDSVVFALCAPRFFKMSKDSFLHYHIQLAPFLSDSWPLISVCRLQHILGHHTSWGAEASWLLYVVKKGFSTYLSTSCKDRFPFRRGFFT